MPNRETIAREIVELKNSGQDIVRRKYVDELSKYTKRDTVIYFSGYHIPRSIQISPAALMLNLQ